MTEAHQNGIKGLLVMKLPVLLFLITHIINQQPTGKRQVMKIPSTEVRK